MTPEASLSHRAGYWIATNFTGPNTAVFTFVLLALLCWLRWKRGHGLASMQDLMTAGLSLFAVCTGVAVGCVLMLTRPPAVAVLSGVDLAVSGFVTVLATVYLGVEQVWRIFVHRQLPVPRDTTAEPPPAATGLVAEKDN